jgi:hypothetical protein
MATAELGSSAAMPAMLLEPGISEAEYARDPVLPSQDLGQMLLASNLKVEFLPPDQLPNPRPPRVQFAGIRDPRLQVVNPIPLDVSVEESTVIVCWPAINEFGTGETLSSAIDDFAGGVRELYHHLFAPDVTLGPDLLKTKDIVGQYIQPRK